MQDTIYDKWGYWVVTKDNCRSFDLYMYDQYGDTWLQNYKTGMEAIKEAKRLAALDGMPKE